MAHIATDDGHWINEDFERVARLVQDYDPNLEVHWIPYGERTRDNKEPYRVFDTVHQTTVFYFKETDGPVDIITRLFNGDNKHGDVLARIEKMEAAHQALLMQEQADRLEEAEDMAKFLISTPLHTVRIRKGLKVDDQIRRMS